MNFRRSPAELPADAQDGRLVGSIRELLAAHPKVVRVPLRARFVGFGPSSLDIESHTYVGTRDVEEFFAIREELFLGNMDLVAKSGTGFAVPSQTPYLGRDGIVRAGSGNWRRRSPPS